MVNLWVLARAGKLTLAPTLLLVKHGERERESYARLHYIFYVTLSF